MLVLVGFTLCLLFGNVLAGLSTHCLNHSLVLDKCPDLNITNCKPESVSRPFQCLYSRCCCKDLLTSPMFNYLEFEYCTMNAKRTSDGRITEHSQSVSASKDILQHYSGVVLLCLILFYQFTILGSVADEYFAPIMAELSNFLGVSHNVAGVTFLAIGNGAPDLAASMTALRNGGNQTALGLGALLGAAVFDPIFVSGMIAVSTDEPSVARRPFLRDCFFIVLATSVIFVFCEKGSINVFGTLSLFLVYAVFVSLVVLGEAYNRWKIRKRKRKRQRRKRAPHRREEEIEESHSLSETESLVTSSDSDWADPIMPVLGIFSNESAMDLNYRGQFDVDSPAGSEIGGPFSDRISVIPAIAEVDNSSGVSANPSYPRLRRNEAKLDSFVQKMTQQIGSPRVSNAILPLLPDADADTDSSSENADDDLDEFGTRARNSSFFADRKLTSVVPSDVHEFYEYLNRKQKALDQALSLSMTLSVPTITRKKRTMTISDTRPSSIIQRSSMGQDLEQSVNLSTQVSNDSGMKTKQSVVISQSDEQTQSSFVQKMKWVSRWITAVILFPTQCIMCLCSMTIPECRGDRWSEIVEIQWRGRTVLGFGGEWQVVMALCCEPLFIGYSFNLLSLRVYNVPIWMVCWLSGVLLSLSLLYRLHVRNEDETIVWRGWIICCAFLSAISWINVVAGELVNILTTLGVISGISLSLLGLSVLAWGNSFGDLIADVSVAKRGFPRMAMSAAVGGPCLNLCIGTGLGTLVGCLHNGGHMKLPLTSEIFLGCVSVMFGITVMVIWVVMNGWKLNRWLGRFNLAFYTVFLVVNILVYFGLY